MWKVALVVMMSLLAPACSDQSTDPAPVCTAGSTQSCICYTGAEGVATCLDGGFAWACACLPAPDDPRCAGLAYPGRVCNSDGTVTFCQAENVSSTSSCVTLCQQRGNQYLGYCGTQYNGQASEDGQPVCWCK